MSALSAQITAAKAYLRLLTEIEECSRLYLEAGIEVPELLRELIAGDERTGKASNGNGNVTKKAAPVPVVPAPVPYRP